MKQVIQCCFGPQKFERSNAKVVKICIPRSNWSRCMPTQQWKSTPPFKFYGLTHGAQRTPPANQVDIYSFLSTTVGHLIFAAITLASKRLQCLEDMLDAVEYYFQKALWTTPLTGFDGTSLCLGTSHTCTVHLMSYNKGSINRCTHV